MPWNEPGNSSNNKDPWTGRPKQTPPDLEAILRDLLKKIATLLKLRPSHKGTFIRVKAFSLSQLNAGIMGLACILLLLAWLFSGFFTVNSSEQAIVTRFGQYVTTLSLGRHWILKPIESYYVIHPQKNDPLSYSVNLLTRDDNAVSIVATLHYMISDARQYLFGNKKALQSLQAITISVLQQTVGQLSLEQLLTANLSILQQTLQLRINQSLVKYGSGLILQDIELQPIQVPEALKASFVDLASARADKEQLEQQARAYAIQIKSTINEQSERLIANAKTYQQKVILQARVDTTRFLALLPAYEAAPELTRKRLYMDAIQSMLAHSNKVLIDNSVNTSLHFSLDDTISQKLEKTNASGDQANEKSLAASTNTTASNANSRPFQKAADDISSIYLTSGGYE